MRKLSRQATYLMMSLCIITGLLSDLVHAQSAKDLVGAWIAVSNVAEQGGVKSEPYGATPQGMLIFEADGRYGLILSRNNVPKVRLQQPHQWHRRREQGGRTGDHFPLRPIYREPDR